MIRRYTSVAMTAAVANGLVAHLIRSDGQEDLCLATYRPSSGSTRTSALIAELLLPEKGERQVHGNVTFTADYVLRAAETAREHGCGLVLLHSHPGARRWQPMSGPDRDAESSYANLVRELTGLPLVGMTLASGDRTWSARHWDIGVGRQVDCTHSTNVRVVGNRLAVSWNDAIRPPPLLNERQVRTLSSWGEECQADLARRRILVVGAGSVGLDVAVRLAASGLCRLTVMDFDNVETHNLDRLIGATPRDVRLRRPKLHIARRETTRAATARGFQINVSDLSICEPEGLQLALDHDLIFSCVDRPWPRAVLNALAYTDLIPVIDGGIAIDTFDNGKMRNAVWRSHVIRPHRSCMICIRQLNPRDVTLDRQGLLDDPAYIAGINGHLEQPTGQNVAPLSINVSAGLLSQYVSFSVAPIEIGDPGPLRYTLNTHELEKYQYETRAYCYIEKRIGVGDERLDITCRHAKAENQRKINNSTNRRLRFLRLIDNMNFSVEKWLSR